MKDVSRFTPFVDNFGLVNHAWHEALKGLAGAENLPPIDPDVTKKLRVQSCPDPVCTHRIWLLPCGN